MRESNPPRSVFGHIHVWRAEDAANLSRDIRLAADRVVHLDPAVRVYPQRIVAFQRVYYSITRLFGFRYK